jgi:hypothetical protein
MNNKIILIMVAIATSFLVIGFFLGNKNSIITVNTSNVSTTTESEVHTSTSSVQKVSLPVQGVVVKKTVPVITNNYIKIGQRIVLEGVYITPINVAYDSRCPKDVQCIQAGSVDVGMLLESGNLSQNVIITSGKPFLFAGKVITLTSVIPAKIATKTITTAEYRFLITVSN